MVAVTGTEVGTLYLKVEAGVVVEVRLQQAGHRVETQGRFQGFCESTVFGHFPVLANLVQQTGGGGTIQLWYKQNGVNNLL